ncbi:MAG: hypothetical protein R3F20_17085 [Planctomycetota bacterium]
MSSRLTVGGLALLLIALVWFVWRAMGDAEAPELQSDGARTSARSEREAGDRSDARRVRSDDAALERPPVPVRSPGELVFEVVDEQGEAVVGAEILGRRPEPPPNRRHATRDPDDANDVISAVGRDPARRERLGRSGTTGELRLEGTTWDSIWTTRRISR